MRIQQFFKRQMDFWGALFLLALFAIPFLLIAILIKLDSKGPVLFMQERLGKDGKVFRMPKFRTMVDKASTMGKGIELERDDWRITRVGKWLRKFRIDEFPQLWLVCIGQMSLVGPRPGLPYHLEKYTAEEKKRLVWKPGMTSLDMIRGGNALSWKERIILDLWYIEHWSLFLDVKIIWGTFWILLSGKEDIGEKGIVEDYK